MRGRRPTRDVPLTRRQAQAWRAMVRHLAERRRPISLRDLNEALGLPRENMNASACHLRALINKGWAAQDGKGKSYVPLRVRLAVEPADEEARAVLEGGGG